MKKSEQGNVLFLILIAVALFAALSYAVTQSTRGGGNTQEENAKITASEILQISTSLKVAVDRMRIRDGLSIDEIFINNGGTGAPCTSGTACLFAPEGGGMAVPTHPAIDAVRYGEPGDGWLVAGMGTAAEDLFIVFDVTETVCTAINDLLGLANPPELSGGVGTGTSYVGAGIFCEGFAFSATDHSFIHTFAYQ